jgi:hypothetical protein
LLQIFFEALSNAIDNVARGARTIKVTNSEKEGMISVYNDNYGINTDWHEQKNMYMSEWVFTTYKCGDRWKIERHGDRRPEHTWCGAAACIYTIRAIQLEANVSAARRV